MDGISAADLVILTNSNSN